MSFKFIEEISQADPSANTEFGQSIVSTNDKLLVGLKYKKEFAEGKATTNDEKKGSVEYFQLQNTGRFGVASHPIVSDGNKLDLNSNVITDQEFATSLFYDNEDDRLYTGSSGSTTRQGVDIFEFVKEEGSYKKIHHIRQDPNISDFGSSLCVGRIANEKNPDIFIGAKDDGIYIYRFDTNTNKYKVGHKIDKPSGTGYFGASMCMVKKSERTKDLLLVGNKSANSNNGVVHVYKRSVGSWTKLIDIQPPSGSPEAFGASLFADGDNVYIGALGVYTGGDTKGAVHVYKYDTITDDPITTIRPPARAEVGKRFGSSISVSVEKNNKGKIIKKNVYIGEKWTTVDTFTLSGTVYRYLKTY
jgi:hypothetical protein